MNVADEDVHGPVDYLVLEFESDRAQGEMADALADLVERGLIRIFDLVVIQKLDDGSFRGLELADLDDEGLGELTLFAGAASGLLDDEDIGEAAAVLEPGTTAAVLLYENSWAAPFVAAARRAGAEVVASGRIPADAILETLEQLEAAGT